MDISKLLSTAELDSSSKRPLYMQIAKLISVKIRDHILPPGFKLPPERELADLFAVSRTTAINAYRHLEQLGLIRIKVGSGTYVAEPAQDLNDLAPDVPWPQLFVPYPQTPLSSILRELVSTPASETISLAAGMGDPSFYPMEIFTSLFNKYIGQLNKSDFGHIPTEGYAPLRQSVVKMLFEKGISAAKDNIAIISGAQQGLYLLTKVLVEPGDYVVTEAPTFIGALQVFQAAGAKILSLPAGNNFSITALEDFLIRYRPKMLYLMPTFQNPSGHVMPLKDRIELLQLAARYRLVIVEDDPYSEMSYGETPPPALKALDSYGGVIYLGTFSKILFSGLRTGYIAASPIVINRIALEKQYIDLHSSNISQWLIHLFLENGHLADHITHVRKEYKKRRDVMNKALRRYCGNTIDFNIPDGGFYFWCKLKHSGTSRRLLHEATKNGVYFVPGEAFYAVPAQDKEFRLCFTTNNPDILVEGVQRLSRALSQIKRTKNEEDSQPFSPLPPIL